MTRESEDRAKGAADWTGNGSPSLIAASQSTRTPLDVLLARLAPPLWLIVWEPDGDGEIQMPLSAARNERSALNFLVDQYRSGTVLVLHILEDGRWTDVTEDFARMYAAEMRRADWSTEYILREVPFIGKYLTEDEIRELR